ARIALLALQQPADGLRAPFAGDHPGAIDPRRIVTNMLIVTAGEFRNPVALVVFMEAGDLLVHDSKHRIPLYRSVSNDDSFPRPSLAATSDNFAGRFRVRRQASSSS